MYNIHGKFNQHEKNEHEVGLDAIAKLEGRKLRYLDSMFQKNRMANKEITHTYKELKYDDKKGGVARRML